MRKLLFTLIYIIPAVLAQTQVLTIKDKESMQPVEMATLFSENPKASALTNAHGQADIRNFKGSAAIEIRMIGYLNQTRSYSDLEKSDFLILLVPSSLSLEQYTVVASRWNQSTRDVPAKITTITAKEIAIQNPQTAADLLSASGEVFIQKSQLGGGSPMIRGFATNRLLITVDGVRMNTAIFRSGNLQNVISLDPFAIERAEVLFGPGSVIYGSDAIGGVMGFNTLTPKLSVDTEPVISGSAVTRYSSAANEKTGHFDVNVGWKKFAMVSSFSYNDFGDLRMGTNGPDEYLRQNYVKRMDTTDVVVTNDDPLVQRPTGYQQINLMEKLKYQPVKNLNINYAFHYSTTTNYSRFDRLLRTNEDFLPRSAEWYYGPQEWIMNNLTVTHSMNSGIYDEFSIRLTHQFFEESRIDRDFNDSERRSRVEKVNAMSANFDFTKRVGKMHNLMYGLEAVYDDVNSTGTDEDITTGDITVGPARYPMSEWSSYAAYITYMFKPSEKFTTQAGVRYNQFALQGDFDTTFYPFPYTTMDINNGALTGSLGAIVKPNEKWTLGVNISTGFRAPNVDDAGKVFDSEPGFVIVPNPDLTAEYATNFEIDIAKVFGDFLRIDLTGFYTMLDNAMVRRDFTLNGQDSIDYHGEMSRIQAIQNAANATVWGIQAGLEIKLPSGFGLTSHFNYQEGEEDLDDGTTSPLRHATPWYGITSLSYTLQRLKLDLYGMYSGEVAFKDLAQEEQGKAYMYAEDADGNPYSPGWYTLNFKSMYQITEHFSVTAGLENITDQRYRPYSSGIVAPGRNFIFALKVNF